MVLHLGYTSLKQYPPNLLHMVLDVPPLIYLIGTLPVAAVCCLHMMLRIYWTHHQLIKEHTTMSILSSFVKTITTTLDTATDVISAAQESVSMATTYVHHRAVAPQVVDRDTVVLSTTTSLKTIQDELDEDELLAMLDSE